MSPHSITYEMYDSIEYDSAQSTPGGRRYPYMAVELGSQRYKSDQPAVSAWLKSTRSPLVLAEWKRQLECHPDKVYAEY